MDYEEALRRAHAEGWRDPVKISMLEIEAYNAGVQMERKRVLSILSEIVEDKPMRAYDVWNYVNKIKNTNV